MADVFESLNFEVAAMAEDLHYLVRDSVSGSELARVRPVVTGEWRREESGLLQKVRRFKPWAPLPELRKHHVPRMVFLVSDAQNSPLFFIDRADKLIGHPVMPDCVVATRDGVVGHLTTDHDKELEPPGGPIDSEGLTHIMLLAAYMIVKELNARLHSDVDGASRIAPRALGPGREPYPGYSDVHSSYMRYQEQFIERYEADRKARQRRAANSM